jgi:hypothetical protein
MTPQIKAVLVLLLCAMMAGAIFWAHEVMPPAPATPPAPAARHR